MPRRCAAEGERRAPADRNDNGERGDAGEEILCRKQEREKEGESKDGWGLVGKKSEERTQKRDAKRQSVSDRSALRHKNEGEKAKTIL